MKYLLITSLTELVNDHKLFAFLSYFAEWMSCHSNIGLQNLDIVLHIIQQAYNIEQKIISCPDIYICVYIYVNTYDWFYWCLVGCITHHRETIGLAQKVFYTMKMKIQAFNARNYLLLVHFYVSGTKAKFNCGNSRPFAFPKENWDCDTPCK